jgi:hypothetical protein
MDKDSKWIQQSLEQLAEKQIEEMDNMLAKRYGLPQPTHTDDEIRASTLSELFSGIPYSNNEEK